MYACRPAKSLSVAAIITCAHRPLVDEHFHLHRVADAHVAAPRPASATPAARAAAAASRGRPCSPGRTASLSGSMPVMPTRRLRGPARSRAETLRGRLAAQHARHARQLVHGAVARPARSCATRHVVPLHPVELGVHHVVDRVLEEVADHQHRDAPAKWRASRTPSSRDAARAAARPSARSAARSGPRPSRSRIVGPKPGGRCGPHRLGRRQPHGAQHRADRAQHRRRRR